MIRHNYASLKLASNQAQYFSTVEGVWSVCRCTLLLASTPLDPFHAVSPSTATRVFLWLRVFVVRYSYYHTYTRCLKWNTIKWGVWSIWIAKGMKCSFEGGNARVQSKISLLWRLMNAISSAPVHPDFLKMHKLDKESESGPLKVGRKFMFDNTTITRPLEEMAA